MTVGQILRNIRERKGFLLREAAASLEIDTALLSKYERGDRLPKKVQLIKFSKFYNIDLDQLLIAWLSDKIVNELDEEELAIEALSAAQEKVKSKASKNI